MFGIERNIQEGVHEFRVVKTTTAMPEESVVKEGGEILKKC